MWAFPFRITLPSKVEDPKGSGGLANPNLTLIPTLTQAWLSFSTSLSHYEVALSFSCRTNFGFIWGAENIHLPVQIRGFSTGGAVWLTSSFPRKKGRVQAECLAFDLQPPSQCTISDRHAPSLIFRLRHNTLRSTRGPVQYSPFAFVRATGLQIGGLPFKEELAGWPRSGVGKHRPRRRGKIHRSQVATSRLPKVRVMAPSSYKVVDVKAQFDAFKKKRSG